MENKPLVSIIIPCYNRANIIKDTLNSVINQSYTQWECIVVDDGSTDKTADIVNKYLNINSSIKYCNRPEAKAKGPSACRNYGISIAKGEYVIFLDSDDVLSKNCLEIRVQKIAGKSNLDFVVFAMGKFKDINDLKVDEKRKIFIGSKEDTIKRFLLYKFPWNTTTPIYRKSFIEKKGFNENLSVFTDPELALRILLTSSPNYETQDITDCYYRVDDSYEDRYLNIAFRQKIVENYCAFLSSVLDHMKEVDIQIFSNELKFNYQKFIIDYYDVDNNGLRNKIKNIIYKKVEFSFLEKTLLKLHKKVF